MDNANNNDLAGVLDYCPTSYNSLKYVPVKQNNILSTQNSFGTSSFESKSSQVPSGRIFVNQNYSPYSNSSVSSVSPSLIVPSNSATLVPTTITTTSNTTSSPSATVMLNQQGTQTVLNSGSFNTDLSAINPSVSIMMKPIGSSNPTILSATFPSSTTTTTTTTTTKKPNDKFINIGIESIKINGAVPFKQLRNPLKNDSSKDSTHKNQHNSSTNLLPSTTTTTTTPPTVYKPDSSQSANTAFQNKLKKFMSINQESIESCGREEQFQIQKNDLHTENTDPLKTIYNDKKNELTPTRMLEMPNSQSPINQNKNNGQSDNENSALCNPLPRGSTCSESNSSNRKEKKSSVGYRLGKRKLLFEKRRQISDYALIFAMTGIFLMVIETELSMSGLYNKSSIYSIITKSLITCTTIILVSLIFLYHALEVQVNII